MGVRVVLHPYMRRPAAKPDNDLFFFLPRENLTDRFSSSAAPLDSDSFESKVRSTGCSRPVRRPPAPNPTP